MSLPEKCCLKSWWILGIVTSIKSNELQSPIAFLQAYWEIIAREKFIPSSKRTLQRIFVVRFVVCIDLTPYSWHTRPVNSGILFLYQSSRNGTSNHLPRSLIILVCIAESLNPLPSPHVSLLTNTDTFVVLLRKTLVRWPPFSPTGPPFWSRFHGLRFPVITNLTCVYQHVEFVGIPRLSCLCFYPLLTISSHSPDPFYLAAIRWDIQPFSLFYLLSILGLYPITLDMLCF